MVFWTLGCYIYVCEWCVVVVRVFCSSKSYLLLLLLLLLCLTPLSSHCWEQFDKYILTQTVDDHEEIYTYNLVCSGCCSNVFTTCSHQKYKCHIFSCGLHHAACTVLIGFVNCVWYICAYCVACICFQFLVVTIISFLLQVTIGVIAFIYREEVSYLQ